jgi:hypothetical protein
MLVFPGDTVMFVPVSGDSAKAALVIGTKGDGTADLRIFNGYCDGTTDAAGVPQSEGGVPGSFFYPRGTKGAGRLNLPMNDSTDTTVALENGSSVAASGDNLLIDQEYMTITDASDPNNLVVTRAQGGSSIAVHAAGTLVKIGVALPQ